MKCNVIVECPRWCHLSCTRIAFTLLWLSIAKWQQSRQKRTQNKILYQWTHNDGKHHQLNKCLMRTNSLRTQRYHFNRSSYFFPILFGVLLVTGLDNWLMRCLCLCVALRCSLSHFNYIVWCFHHTDDEYVLSGIRTSACATNVER